MTLHRYTPYYKPLTMLGVPIVVGQLGTIVLAFADTLMIGHHATSELAAAAFVNNIINLVIIFALGFSYAVTPTVGTLYGQEKTQRIGEMVRNAICANLLLAALIVGVMGGFYLSIDHLGQPAELLPLIKPYYLVLLASLPFVCPFNVFKQFADGITDTALSMWVLIGGNILNIFGNWVLIYGQLGAPELGLTGAGLSTLASRVVMAVAMMVVFFSRRKYRAYAQGFLRGRINRDGMQIVFGNSLRGLAHVRPLVIYAFLAFFVISLPLSYLFGITLDLGLIGVWYSFPFGLTTSGLLYFLAFRRQLDRLTRSGSERLATEK